MDLNVDLHGNVYIYNDNLGYGNIYENDNNHRKKL
jgi:hypothetical protein